MLASSQIDAKRKEVGVGAKKYKAISFDFMPSLPLFSLDPSAFTS